jgi:hypothetical protein
MKALTPAMQAHIRQGVTTLATCMEIRRRDGKSFRFTSHDDVVTVAANDYIPYSSFERTSISTGVDLEVDQMEVHGILNSKHVNRADVAAGMFDFAEVRVFVLNYEQPDAGQIALRVGWLGEVIMAEDETFTAELRGLTQVYTYRIGAAYQPECRADLGDRKCKIAIDPQRWSPGSLYRKGDVVLGAVNPATAYLNLEFVNGSFDQDATTLGDKIRDLPGWTTYGDANGRWTLHQDKWFGLGGQEGYAAFNTDTGVDGNPDAPHTVADLGMYQDLDLVAQGASTTSLDTGLCRLFSTLWYACVNGKEAGVRYQVFALDGNGAQIGTSAIYDTGLVKTAEDRWFQWTVQVLIPAGTRRLRFDLFAHKRAVYNEGGAFDTITAAINDPDGTLGSAEQFGSVSFQCVTPGASGMSEPAWNNALGATTTDSGVTWKAIASFKKTTTVDGATSGGRVIIPTSVTDVDGYYDGGLLVWETGPNAGRSQEIKSWAAGVLNLFQRPTSIPQVGDRFTIHPGCDKTRSTCSTKFSNILNFRGEPDVPGQDKYYTGPNAPAS